MILKYILPTFTMETNEQCISIVGTCQTMCSEHEIKLREERELLHPFELQKKSRNVDRSKAVKEYSRPAAGKSDPVPSELRPGPVLLTTTRYLIQRVLTLTNWPWHYVYEFVFDRLRAVRQDMTIQRLHDNAAVHILERAIRVMIYAHYRLCESPPSHFDAKINGTHIQECLKRLLCLYLQDSTCRCHQGDFVALYLMFNLGSPEALVYGLERKQTLSHCSSFCQALAISLAWWRRNYARVFRLVRMLPVLHMCAFNNVRHIIIRESVSIMCSGYNSKNLSFPLADLQHALDLGSRRSTRDLCEACGLEILPNGCVKMLKASLKQDAKITPKLQQSVEDDLLWEDLPQLLIGTKCPCLPDDVT